MCNNGGESEMDKMAMENLQAYIKIPTISSETDYADCISFLTCAASKIPLECTKVNLCPKPALIMKLPGTVSCSQSIVLSSHMDVGPVTEAKWEHPPFSGQVDDKGKIFGRGMLDIKSQAIQYMEAVRRLIKDGCKLKRTVIIVFVPDEKSGSQEGMKKFVGKPEFKCLNAGFWLDESGPTSCARSLILYNGERHRCITKFTIEGCVGPSHLNLPKTAGEKLGTLLKIITEFRKKELEKGGCVPDCPDVTSINITDIEVVKEPGMIPESFVVTVDARLPADTCPDLWKCTLKSWIKEVGDGCCMKDEICEFLDKATPLNSRYYAPFKETVCEMKFELQSKINPGCSDARYVRNAGIDAYGFSVQNGVEAPMDGQNEFLAKETFLKGIEVYYTLLKKLGNMGC